MEKRSDQKNNDESMANSLGELRVFQEILLLVGRTKIIWSEIVSFDMKSGPLMLIFLGLAITIAIIYHQQQQQQQQNQVKDCYRMFDPKWVCLKMKGTSTRIAFKCASLYLETSWF